MSVKSQSLERDPTGKGKSSLERKFLFQSTISSYKHICSFLRENRLLERLVLKILVKVNVPSRFAHTSKIIFFTRNRFF